MNKKQVEQSIWAVKINAQTLYRKAVDGRTILLGMTQEENEKVAEVMDKAISDVAKILEKRTTQHELSQAKEQVTTVDNSRPTEEKESQTIEEASVPHSKVKRGPGGKFISKSSSKKTKEESSSQDEVDIDENKGSWDSIYNKLRS